MDFEQLFKWGMDRDIPPPLDFPAGQIINVGAGTKHIEGAASIDYPEWDADLEPLPYLDNSIAGIHAYHFLEHVCDPVALLLEFQRVLQMGISPPATEELEGVAVKPSRPRLRKGRNLRHSSQIRPSWRAACSRMSQPSGVPSTKVSHASAARTSLPTGSFWSTDRKAAAIF